MTATAQSNRFGEIAIELGLVRELEVRGALAQQRQPGWEWGVGSILVQQGKITLPQIQEVLSAQGIRYQPLEPGRRKGHSETRLGKLATERGYISFTELVRGLESQRKVQESTGEQPPLGKVLVDLNLLDHNALAELLEEMGVLVCLCHTCNLAFNLIGDPGERTICCPECHSRYVAPSREHVLAIRGNLFFPRPKRQPRNSGDSRRSAIPVDAIQARPRPTPGVRAVPAPRPVTRPDPGVEPEFPLSPEVVETQKILGQLVDHGVISEETAIHVKHGGLAQIDPPSNIVEESLPQRRAPVFPHAVDLAGSLPGSTADSAVPPPTTPPEDDGDGALGVVAAEKRRPFLDTPAPVQRGFFSLYVSEDSETFSIPPDEARLSQASQEVIIKSSNRPKLPGDDLDSAPLPDEFEDMVRIVEVDGDEDGKGGQIVTTVIKPDDADRDGSADGADTRAKRPKPDRPGSRRNPSVPDAIVMSTSPGRPPQHRQRHGSSTHRFIGDEEEAGNGPGPLSSTGQPPTGATEPPSTAGDIPRRARRIAHSKGSPREAPVGPPPADTGSTASTTEVPTVGTPPEQGMEVFQIVPGGGVIPSGTEYPAGTEGTSSHRKTPTQPPTRMLGTIPPQPSWDIASSGHLDAAPSDADDTAGVDSDDFPDSDSYSVHHDEGDADA